MDLTNPPERYWHCLARAEGEKDRAVVNDLDFPALKRTVIDPYLAGRPFTISGKVIRSENVGQIQIAHTPEPMDYYANQHDAEMDAIGWADFVTDRRLLPFAKGEDVTFDFLFKDATLPAPEADVALVEQLCRRLPKTAGILASRKRGKDPFRISDEYDVQDLLHALLRGYLKYSVQEDPLPKAAGIKSGRPDISIEELGVLIEPKYVRSPEDQRRIFEEISQDLVLYPRWAPLRTLIFVIYNSSDLRDPEALEKLGGVQEVSGKRFNVKIVLA